MTDSCCSIPEPENPGSDRSAQDANAPAGNILFDLPVLNAQPPTRPAAACPVCGQKGRPVPGQTVKALLSVSLRQVQDGEYLFCKTADCPVVYYAADGGQTFTVVQVREPVYQKEADSPEAPVCYCFRHTVGELSAAAPESRQAILDDITLGTQTGQCACDLRNPQGSCCLGNVRALVKRLDAPDDVPANSQSIAEVSHGSV